MAMARSDNLLARDDRPLFFPLADPAAAGLRPPAIREGRGEAVRLAARSLTVMQKEALVASGRTGRVWRLVSDEGAYLDGHDVAPCPLSFLSTGMVASYYEEMTALARQRGIAIDGLELVQDNYYTMKGSARRGTMTGGARDIDLEIIIDPGVRADPLRALALDAVAASPLNGLMRGYKESLFTLTHNGREIETARALRIDGPALADPEDLFANVRPDTATEPSVVRTGEMTPKNENTETFAGGSLADEQNRLLHVRVRCRRRSDGVKEILQYLYNPHGTIFRFLSEEAPGADGAASGGRGRHPDAASYMAAGIGFCFMTQFGRYAKIVGKPIEAYRLVEDMHMTLGGASGGTGRPGDTDPIETHVHLVSGQDDSYARTALDMAEQTCFLHAFCKASLKAMVKISPRAKAA